MDGDDTAADGTVCVVNVGAVASVGVVARVGAVESVASVRGIIRFGVVEDNTAASAPHVKAGIPVVI